jgi:hypothetical protein
MGKRPWFAAEIPDIFYGNSHFLLDFPVNCLLKILTGFYKAGDQPVKLWGKMGGSGKENLIFLLEQDNDRRGEPRVRDQVAVRTEFRPFGPELTGLRTAPPAELRGTVEIDDLDRESRDRQFLIRHPPEQFPDPGELPAAGKRSPRSNLGGITRNSIPVTKVLHPQHG